MARTLLGLLIIILLVVIALVWTGWISVNTQGQFRTPTVTTQGGEVPSVNVDTKKVVVGTTQKVIEVPVVKTEDSNSSNSQ